MCNSHKIGLLLNIKKLQEYLFYIGNDMETSGLLLVSVFCSMQRTPLIDGKGTIKFRISYSIHGEKHRNYPIRDKIAISCM